MSDKQSILMSIHPEYAQRIFSGKKQIELRKTLSRQLLLPYKVYLYATKSGLPVNDIKQGCIVGDFVCDGVYRLVPMPERVGLVAYCIKNWHDGSLTQITQEWLDATTLTAEELEKYGNGKTIYGYRIYSPYKYVVPAALSKDRTAPQSWCYIKGVPWR